MNLVHLQQSELGLPISGNTEESYAEDFRFHISCFDKFLTENVYVN